MGIKALLFDFDGLILETEGPIYQSWRELYQYYGMELPLAEFAKTIGVPENTFDLLGRLEEQLGRSLQRDEIAARRRQRELDLIHAQASMPGVLETLHSARRLGLKLAVVSSSSRSWVAGHLARLGLLDLFDQVVTREAAPRAKPDPGLYRAALRLLAASSDQAVAFEDSPSGIRAAKGAGIYCVAVPNGLTRGLPLDEADLRLESLAGLSLEALLPAIESQRKFQRTPTTWLAYLLLSFYAFMAAMFGPLLPSLRAELGMSYSLGGLHLSALAVGMILVGLAGNRLVARWGRIFTLRLAGLGAAAGALLLALGRQPAWTMTGVLLIGLCGALVQVMVQAILSSLHGERRAVALTEANIGAGLSAMLAPLLVGGFQRLGFGWRPALLLGVGLLLGLILAIPRRAIPDAPAQTAGSDSSSRLPGAFWAYWAVVIMAVAVEWCMMVWSADFLEKAVGLPRADAAITMSLFYLAYVLGRVAGSRLSHRLPAAEILLLAFGFTLLGFPLFWLPRLPWLNIAGLVAAGFGVANLFPLAMTAAVGAAPQQPDAASARVSLALGGSVLVAPLVLGSLADRVGIRGAYAIVPPLLVIAILWTVNSTRRIKRSPRRNT